MLPPFTLPSSPLLLLLLPLLPAPFTPFNLSPSPSHSPNPGPQKRRLFKQSLQSNSPKQLIPLAILQVYRCDRPMTQDRGSLYLAYYRPLPYPLQIAVSPLSSRFLLSLLAQQSSLSPIDYSSLTIVRCTLFQKASCAEALGSSTTQGIQLVQWYL